jgi:hypothetical protein
MIMVAVIVAIFAIAAASLFGLRQNRLADERNTQRLHNKQLLNGIFSCIIKGISHPRAINIQRRNEIRLSPSPKYGSVSTESNL